MMIIICYKEHIQNIHKYKTHLHYVRLIQIICSKNPFQRAHILFNNLLLFTIMDSVKNCDEYGDNFCIEADEQSLKDLFDKIEKLTEVQYLN